MVLAEDTKREILEEEKFIQDAENNLKKAIQDIETALPYLQKLDPSKFNSQNNSAFEAEIRAAKPAAQRAAKWLYVAAKRVGRIIEDERDVAKIAGALQGAVAEHATPLAINAAESSAVKYLQAQAGNLRASFEAIKKMHEACQQIADTETTMAIYQRIYQTRNFAKVAENTAEEFGIFAKQMPAIFRLFEKLRRI